MKTLGILTKPVSEKVPDGFKTVAQFAKELGRSNARVLIALNEAVKNGLAEMRDFKIKLQSVSRPVRHYRILQKKKRK